MSASILSRQSGSCLLDKSSLRECSLSLWTGTGSACTGESQAGVLGALKAALGVMARDTSSEADRRQSTGTGRRSSVCGGGKRGRRMIVAVLDEMDQLISQDQSVLYELFTLPQVSAATSTQMSSKAKQWWYSQAVVDPHECILIVYSGLLPDREVWFK